MGKTWKNSSFGNVSRNLTMLSILDKTGGCFKSYERPPKPPTFWNSYTRTLILDTIMKLSGTIGVTQKTMTFDTHVWLFFFTNVKSLGTMRDTRKTMTISATSFRGCNRFSPLLISFHAFQVCIHMYIYIYCIILYTTPLISVVDGIPFSVIVHDESMADHRLHQGFNHAAGSCYTGG